MNRRIQYCWKADKWVICHSRCSNCSDIEMQTSTERYNRLEEWKKENGKMNAISKGTLEVLRKTYKQGTRVKLICMDDTQAPPKGTKGTVVGVDDMGSVMVQWDNGSSLSLVYGVDSAWILHSVTTVCYGEKIVWDSRDDALAFFLNGIQNSEGSEQERYATIYSQLKSGEDFASDEVE